MCAYSFVRTVNALVLQGKTPPAQVAAGDDDHDCKWSIFASWWKEKHHQRKLRSVKTILGTSIGAGCSNQMQVAQGQDLHFKVVPLCKLHLAKWFIEEMAKQRTGFIVARSAPTSGRQK